jgi:hypothetical protein
LADFSFHWLWRSDSLDTSGVASFVVAINNHRFPGFWQDHEFWSFQMSDRIEVNFWKSRNVNISISSMKIRLCFLGMIRKTMLFILKIWYLRFPSCPQATYLYRARVRSPLIGSHKLQNPFLTPLTLIPRLAFNVFDVPYFIVAIGIHFIPHD